MLAMVLSRISDLLRNAAVVSEISATMRSNAPARIRVSPVSPGGTASRPLLAKPSTAAVICATGLASERDSNADSRTAATAANSATIRPELCSAAAGAMMVSSAAVSITPARSPPGRVMIPTTAATRWPSGAVSTAAVPFLSPSAFARSGKSSCQRRVWLVGTIRPSRKFTR